jgi:hypothetical protein
MTPEAPRTALRVTFPSWARIALGALVALVTYFVAGDFINIGEAERTLISSVVVLLGSVGVVPPRPEDIRMSQTVSVVLTILALVISYLLNTLIDDDLVRGILLAVLALGSSIGITPPQTRIR